MLYIVPTPIGNLKDFTFRAIEILKNVDLILAEDTRTSGVLLKHYQIVGKLESYHSHNEHKRTEYYVSLLQEGLSIALISDAGMPGISDPGFLLIRACVDKGLKVSCLPGANAFLPALIASGLPCDRFFFEGFLPHKKGRQTRLQFLANLDYTFIIYESPFRLIKCLEQLKEHCGGDRKICVAREISKIHEEFSTNTIDKLLADYTTRNTVKGELVLIVAGKPNKN